jgi:hypothetical protein
VAAPAPATDINNRHSVAHPHQEKTMTSHTAYIEKVKLQLDELNASLNHLETKAHEARVEARATYFEEMAKLRHQSALAVAKLEEIKTSTEEGWEKAAAEMEKVRNAFVHAFSYFKSQL